MIAKAPSKGGFGKVSVVLALACVVIAVLAIVFARPLRRYLRESLMQSVTSAHYRILCPPGAMSQEAMTQFAMQRETIYLSLNRKLNDVASNAEIRVIFDPKFKATEISEKSPQDYEVTGATIRTGLKGLVPQLNRAADAEALLNIAWGQPGNPLIAHWIALWLVGQWQGQELGMAAAKVEQRVGHKKVANLLSQPPDAATSSQDRALLGAAWVNAIAELGGARQCPETLFREADEVGCGRGDEGARNNANGTRTKMADVDLCVYCGNASGKSFYDDANGHADVQIVQIADDRRNSFLPRLSGYKLIASYLAAIVSSTLPDIGE